MSVGDTVSLKLDSGTTWGKLLKPSKVFQQYNKGKPLQRNALWKDSMNS